MLWLLLLTTGVLWWHFAAPIEIGGGTSFVIVQGQSMEPMLHDGDLAVARARGWYTVGDLVVFGVGEGRVIHRIVAGSPTAWVTKGDSNPWLDPWPVSDADILGAYSASVAGGGNGLIWLLGHPFGFGAAAAVAIVASYLPRHRRKIHPALAAALAVAVPEPRRAGRPMLEYLVLWLLIAGSTATYLVTMMAFLRGVWSAAALCAAGGLGVCLVLTWGMLHRLYDGFGLPEPTRSIFALSGRLQQVPWLPSSPEPITSVSSAVALRRVAECQRLPVLHHVDPVTGDHSFVVITAHGGMFTWTPTEGGNPRLREAVLASVVGTVAHVPRLPEHARSGSLGVLQTAVDADLHRLLEPAPAGHVRGREVEPCDQ